MNSKKVTLLESLKKDAAGYWAERILSQMNYAVKLSNVNGGKFDNIIEKALDYLVTKQTEDGVISKTTALNTENMIKEMSIAAKSFKMICAAHAHIDMNWQWGFAETVAITLDTFRTMLNLMKEYTDFKFSQSQASVYRIVEEYDPDMLQEIKDRIKEGRWEVTASTWVETDKNMPNGESLARHILYTKNYLSKLLDLDPDSLQLDFEPDTFGHSRNLPEILINGGVKYYYHCRGYEGHNLYKWQAPSGSAVIVYREPLWYNATIDANIAVHVPEFCSAHSIDTILKVYGVGDHGGGPTRRDIEKLIEMNTWPVFPSIRFGTFGEFFRILDSIADRLPVVNQELNFIFTGCYTTQTRIKSANRVSEAKMNEAEAFSSLSAVFADGDYPAATYEEAWKKVLFNHFHDILPGSGVIETREYAMGQFQQVLAAANSGISKALKNIASRIDTTSFRIAEEDIRDTISEGAGVGYSIQDFSTPQAERGRGKNRIIHFFNPSAHERKEPVEITIWDWPGDLSRIEFKNIEGAVVKHQVLSSKLQHSTPVVNYWGHEFVRLLVDVAVPAYGYSTYVMNEKELQSLMVGIPNIPRTEIPDQYILENDYIKVVFDTRNISILSMLDKKHGNELTDAKRPAGIFRLIEEDDCKGMTAWTIGRYMNIFDLNRNVKVIYASLDKDALRQWITYSIKFRESRLNVTISLDYNSSSLHFDVECDWQETAQIGKYIPQLNFHMPVAYKCKIYKYDIPFGTIIREDLNQDVPANSWALAIPNDGAGSAVTVATNTKYGFRGTEDSISLTLIRSSYDPDPYPENYIHHIKFAVEVVDAAESNTGLIRKAYEYNHPISFVSGLKHNGGIHPVKSFITLEGGSVALSAVKMPERAENGNSMLVVRVYETEGVKTLAVLKFACSVRKAWYVDLNENRIECGKDTEVEGNIIKFDVDANTVASICIEF